MEDVASVAVECTNGVSSKVGVDGSGDDEIPFDASGAASEGLVGSTMGVGVVAGEIDKGGEGEGAPSSSSSSMMRLLLGFTKGLGLTDVEGGCVKVVVVDETGLVDE